MKRKFFLFCTVAVVMLAVLTIGVSAAEIFNLTLDGVENKREPEEWSDGYDYDETYFEIIDEYIRMYGTKAAEDGENNGETILSMRIPFGKSIEGEVLIYYDIMFPSDEPDCKLAASMQFFLGSNRVAMSHSPNSMEAGKWYNIMVHIDQVNKAAYYRVKPSDSTEWSGKTEISSDSVIANAGAAGFKCYFKPNSKELRFNRGEICFDNIRVIQGLYLDDFKFMLDEAEISSVADITEDGAVKAVFNVANYDLAYNEENILPDTSVFTPMMVAFDKNGMMLDCEIYNDVEIEIYDNPGMEFGLDISSIKEQLEGGTVRLYIWDSIDNMEAIFDEIVLPATVEE